MKNNILKTRTGIPYIEAKENEAPAQTRAFKSSRKIDQPWGLRINGKIVARQASAESAEDWASGWDGQKWTATETGAVSEKGDIAELVSFE